VESGGEWGRVKSWVELCFLHKDFDDSFSIKNHCAQHFHSLFCVFLVVGVAKWWSKCWDQLAQALGEKLGLGVEGNQRDDLVWNLCVDSLVEVEEDCPHLKGLSVLGIFLFKNIIKH
jgi:hypothetical protein